MGTHGRKGGERKEGKKENGDRKGGKQFKQCKMI
jgi:hypothetical protein